MSNDWKRSHCSVCVCARLYRTTCARTHQVFVLSIGHNHGTNQITTSISSAFVILFCWPFFSLLRFVLHYLWWTETAKAEVVDNLKPPLYFDCLNAIYVNCMKYWKGKDVLILILIFHAIFLNKYFFYQFSKNMLVPVDIFSSVYAFLCTVKFIGETTKTLPL